MTDKLSVNKRLRRERITVEKMVRLYCGEKHGFSDNLCIDCSALLKYSEARLINCPYEDNKPVCKDCKHHCYSHVMQDKVKSVMRFSGPRMLLRHPYLAIMHKLDEKLYKPLILRSREG
jgi:hypothetical protein